MLFDSKTCFLLSLRTVMGVKLLRAKWEIHNKVDWQKTNRQKEKNKNQIKKFTVFSKSSSINYGWSKICSFAWNCKFIWCDNIMHTFWFKGNDFYYRLKLRIKWATSESTTISILKSFKNSEASANIEFNFNCPGKW